MCKNLCWSCLILCCGCRCMKGVEAGVDGECGGADDGGWSESGFGACRCADIKVLLEDEEEGEEEELEDGGISGKALVVGGTTGEVEEEGERPRGAR